MSGHRRVKDVAYDQYEIDDAYDDDYDDAEGSAYLNVTRMLIKVWLEK